MFSLKKWNIHAYCELYPFKLSNACPHLMGDAHESLKNTFNFTSKLTMKKRELKEGFLGRLATLIKISQFSKDLAQTWHVCFVSQSSGKILTVIWYYFPFTPRGGNPHTRDIFLANNGKIFRMMSNCFTNPYSLRINTNNHRRIKYLGTFSLFVAADSH